MQNATIRHCKKSVSIFLGAIVLTAGLYGAEICGPGKGSCKRVCRVDSTAPSNASGTGSATFSRKTNQPAQPQQQRIVDVKMSVITRFGLR